MSGTTVDSHYFTLKNMMNYSEIMAPIAQAVGFFYSAEFESGGRKRSGIIVVECHGNYADALKESSKYKGYREKNENF